MPQQQPKLGVLFLLTPLREGRRFQELKNFRKKLEFLLTPLREGRQEARKAPVGRVHFYSRPCGRGDDQLQKVQLCRGHFYSRPCGRGDAEEFKQLDESDISTHAPAGGATE